MVRDTFGPGDRAENEHEALKMLEWWCEENGGDVSASINGPLSDQNIRNPQDYAGSVECWIGDKNIQLSSKANSLSPDIYMEKEGGTMEVRVFEDSRDQKLGRDTHRKIVNPEDINITDTEREIYMDWDTFFVEE